MKMTKDIFKNWVIWLFIMLMVCGIIINYNYISKEEVTEEEIIKEITKEEINKRENGWEFLEDAGNNWSYWRSKKYPEVCTLWRMGAVSYIPCDKINR